MLQAIETSLPVRGFTDQWTQTLQQPPASKWRRPYAEQGKIERVIPLIFALLWLLLFLGRVL